MWRFIAGVCKAKITVIRRVGFVLLGILSLWGFAANAQQTAIDHSFAPENNCPGNLNNPSNPYCLTLLDDFTVKGALSTRAGVLLDIAEMPIDKTGVVQLQQLTLRAPYLTDSSDELFVSCSADPQLPYIYDVNSYGSWTPGVVTMPTTPCLSVSQTGKTYLFRKLHFQNELFDYTKTVDTSALTAPLDNNAKKIIILIHGWNRDSASNRYDTPQFTSLVNQIREQIKNTEWKLVLYHWEKDSATGGLSELSISGTEAAENGHQHGQHLGELLTTKYPTLEKVHFIAHSAGSWVARSAVRYLTENSQVKNQVTLLDPFIPVEAPIITSLIDSLTVQEMTNIILFPKATANNLYLLENTFVPDPAGGTNTWFEWRTTDKTLKIHGYTPDWNYVDQLISWLAPSDLAHSYNNHSGPIQFYADTIAASAGVFSPDLFLTYYTTSQSVDAVTYSPNVLSTFGWKQSMFYQEPQITRQPSDQSNKNIGDTPILYTAGRVRGDPSSGNLIYQWQKFVSGAWTCDDLNSTCNVPNSNYTSYTLGPLTQADHCSQYRVKVYSIVNTRSAGVDVSNPVTVSIAGQGACQGGGGAVVVTPTIQSVSPLSLTTQSSGTQSLTILGTGFTSSSTANFTFDSGTGPVNITALNQPRFISWSELKYDIAVGTTPGTWTVAVANGGLVSQSKVFNVVSPSVVTTAPAAPIGLNSFSGNWTKLNQFTLDWTNPASSAGIAKVWWKIGVAPTSATDGNVASINSAKPLQISLPVVEGQQDVHVWLEDGAGNRSHLNRATIRLGKDITLPGIAITTQLTATTTQSSVTLSGTFSDALSGVNRITWSNNSASSGDAPITPGLSGSWTTQPITLYGGDNYITVTAIDAAGNYTTSAVTIKKTDTTNSGSIMFTLSPPEAVTAGARWRANGGVWHLSGEYELTVPAGVAQVDFQGANNYVAPQGYPVIVTAGQVTQRTASFPHTVVNVPPLVPNNPYPANGTMGLSRVNPSFAWSGGSSVGPVDYAFFFDTNPNPGVYVGYGSTAGASVQLARTLASGTTYYWKVKSMDVNSGTVTESPVWSFTTEYAMPDLIVSNVVLNGNVAPGANVTADVTMQNIGNFPSYGTSYVHVYLSSSPGGKNVRLTPNVPNNVPVLQPGQTQTFNMPVTLTGLQSGTSYLDAWIDSTQAGQVEGNINNNLRSIPLSYLDGQAPSVTYAGLTNTFVKTGIANSIAYVATDDTGIRTVDFYYSVDGGTSWLPIEEGYVPTTPPTYGTTYRWAIPANLPIVSNLKIRVVARDASGNAGEIIAGPYVVHDGTVPTVAVVSPNGGEILPMGSTQQVRWNLSSVNPIAGISISFYYNGTASFIYGGDLAGSGNGTTTWTLPNNLATTNGKIRIQVEDVNGNAAEDFSDGFFTVKDTSAPPAAPWTTPAVITSVPTANWPYTSKGHSTPIVVSDNSGNVHMVYKYEQDDMSGMMNNTLPARVITQKILYKKLVNGTWLAPEVVYSRIQNTDAGMTGYHGLSDLKLSVDNNGYPNIVWVDQVGGAITDMNQNDVYYTSYNGATWSTPFNLSDSIPGAYSLTALTWATKASMPVAKAYAASAVYNGKLYIFGGNQYLTNYVYDPSTNGWSQIADSPSNGVSEGGATVINNKIYAVGSAVNYNELKVYDPAANTWTSGANMPTPRRLPAVATVNGKLYAIGGGDVNLNPYSSVEEYNPSTNTWSTKASMTTARWGAAVAVVDNLIYVFGGVVSGGGNGTNTVEVYNPATDIWISKASAPTARRMALVAVVNGRIYVLGGSNGSNSLNTVEEYDPSTNSWLTKTSMPTARMQAAGGAIGSNIYVVGGYDGTGNVSVNEQVTISAGGSATVSGSPRITIDPSNNAHAVWLDGSSWNSDYTRNGEQNLYYRKKDNAGNWSQVSKLTSGGAWEPSIVSENGNLHLAYQVGSRSIAYMKWDGTSWSSPEITTTTADGLIDLTIRNNKPHMVWYYSDNTDSTQIRYKILYSHNDGSGWAVPELVSDQGYARYPSIAVDSSDRPHVFYEDNKDGSRLLYRYKDPNGWSAPVQINLSSQYVGDDSSNIAISPSDQIHAVWSSSYNGSGEIFYNHANVGYTTDTFPPSVSVSAPFAGTNLSMGSATAIQWSANDSTGVTSVDLHYSTDNGITWTLIAATQPNSGTYSWVVPAATSLQVRVTARDAAGNTGAGFSGTVTTSDTTPPTIILTAPTSGTSLVGNSTVNVNWTATDNVAVTRIDLDYSLDSGVSWLTMASALSNSGSYAWLVPNSPTSALLIRAVAHDAVGYTTVASTAQPLTIVRANAPPLAPSMPFPLAAGVNVPMLSTMLNWTGGDPDGDALTYQIRFGTDANPPVIATVSNNAFAASTLQYSTQYYWQVVASDGNATTASPVWTFTTENDVTAPTGTISINSGAAYTNSTTSTVTLSCTDAGSGCAQMQFSNDNTNWSTAEAYATSKTWTLTSGDVTKTVYVKFKDTAGNWSTAYSGTINLDTTAPTTTASPAGGTYNSTQSVILTCSDGTGSGCDKIYYTIDGTTPTTASTVYSTAISISASQTLKFFAKDLAGNSETVKTAIYTIDTSAPVFTSTSPASSSYISTATVGYSLSAAVLSGKITFTRTGGSADSASHIYNFTDSDKTVGTHSVNTGLSLISGALYTVTFEATDLAGNSATVVSNTGVVYDNTSASVVINSPSSNSRTNSVTVSYTLNEEITSGEIVFTRTGGTADGLSPRKHTLGASEKSSGSHTADTGIILIDGAIYTVGFENVMDKAGNATASVSNTSIAYDSTAVAITNTSPASNGIITNSSSGYTLSEAALSGKVTFTRSGGSADAGSPHVYTLSGPDLYIGSHTVNTTLSLVDGAFYTVSFDATDMAGNAATTVSNAMVFFDSNYGTGPTGNVDNISYSSKRVDGYDLIKLSIAFGSHSGSINWNPVCDLNADGKVDGNDLMILGNYFGEVQ